MSAILDVEKTIENVPELKAAFDEAIQYHQDFLQQMKDAGLNPAGFEISQLLPDISQALPNGVAGTFYMAIPFADWDEKDLRNQLLMNLQDANFETHDALRSEIEDFKDKMQQYERLLMHGNNGPN